MMHILRKPISIFFVLVILLLLIFLLLPINIFDGEIIYQQGLVAMKEHRPLSLHFVAGLEYSPSDLKGIKEYHLLPKGYLMAALFIFGLPALVAYRIKLGKKNRNKS